MIPPLNSVPSVTADEFSDVFFSTELRKRYLFGINEYSEQVANVITIDGFIDDYTTFSDWKGVPVYRLADVDPNSLVLSCVTVARPVTALNKLRQAGIKDYCDYFSLADVSKGKLPQVTPLADTRQDFQEHAYEYQWIRGQFFDAESRDIFDCIMDFRLQGNLQAMARFEYAADRQYFEPFLQLTPEESFVDGGGFDGFTSEQFAARCPEYSAIHFFEPSHKTLALAKAKLSKLKKVHYYPFGLYDSTASLNFDSNAGSASCIDENGDEVIEVVPLDEIISDPVSFIKLDLEGAEPKALRGMKRHILNDHPKLAVAVYHHPSDFWRIPRYILGLRNDYRVFLRHYTEGWTETVMFFIPRY